MSEDLQIQRFAGFFVLSLFSIFLKAHKIKGAESVHFLHCPFNSSKKYILYTMSFKGVHSFKNKFTYLQVTSFSHYLNIYFLKIRKIISLKI
ncbi:hypothetical protein BSF41_44680 [Flavobacterium sp. ACN2]|nr:hypothetical protein BSF41_44680 [Flavobacterium sp. ACN2]